MIPYGKQSINQDDINAVLETLSSDFLTQGKQVPIFEHLLAEKVNAKFAIATSSATAALHLACLSNDLKQGDIGWTVPLTFAASANAIRYCGADVDFVDIDPTTGCICVNELEKKLALAQQLKKLPKVLIVVHFAGISCDMARIKQLCSPFNIIIIEDASHAIGSRYLNEPVGNCLYSDLTIFSFHPVKIITSGEGGMITTNNEFLAKKIKLLASHGITKSSKLLTTNQDLGWYYEQQSLGFNYRMSDIHAALGISQLKRLDDFVELRNQQAQTYVNAFTSLPFKCLTVPKNCLSAWHIFVVKLTKSSSITRKELYNTLISKGIGCQVHYIPVHTHPYYQALGFNWGDFQQSEQFYHQCLTLPLYPELGEQQLEVISTLLDIF